MSPTEQLAPVKRAPAPWATRAECYWMFLTLKSLPQGLYDPLEASSEECVGGKAGDFKGGLGVIMVVRYKDTPVGRYDELAIIPGNFTVPQPANGPPQIPKKARRIARIYVSQRTTMYNGRLNWNIAKHLARFNFSAPMTEAGSSPPASLTVKVFPAGSQEGDGIGPFFSCTLRPWRWVPSLPMSSRWLPVSATQALPPLPEGPGFKEASEQEAREQQFEDCDVSPASESSLLVGTDRWCLLPIDSYSPRARGCWVTVHSAGEDVEGSESAAIEEAGRHWPQEARPWSVGAWMEDAEMTFAEPLEWKL